MNQEDLLYFDINQMDHVFKLLIQNGWENGSLFTNEYYYYYYFI